MRIVGLFLAATCVSAQSIGSRIDQILLRSPAAQQAFWGIRIVNLETGATVYSKNQDHFFIPASNTKLFSTALALTRLGPDHRFRTSITAPALPDEQGRVGSLRFVGGGDPNLSGRAIPYEYNAPRENPLRHVEMFAQKLFEKGLRFVDGDIIGDDSAYAHEPYPEGWALDDPTYEYGAPVSSLFLNDGMFRLVLRPAEFGVPPQIECTPVVDGMVIHNLAVTGAETKLTYTRLPGTSELTIAGAIAKEQEALLGVEQPALIAAQALRDELLKRGVRISGTARVEHFPAPGVALLTYDSHPLIEDLRIINKDSQNLHAEIVLLEVSRARLGVGSREASLIEMKEFLKEIGIADRQYNLLDGSGLSRQTLLTPMTIIKLLLYMYGTKHRDDWISTLPVGGKDGTLAKRFARAASAAKVRAKTGSISHVNALSGYAGKYAFSILVNNSNLQAGPVRRVMDQIALTLAK
ncbi:MAG TPA: D-alanyl-D-alanine carboxypeptidase/D-alanyl-D-alanine-endopeptidase [Bryobacteraceae bacterium]|nr:D-alanyl-D-alanine carboxypeptidase/D-alanyl-D-alanine-endopeptidase [Bryobacteraceae bacterium]